MYPPPPIEIIRGLLQSDLESVCHGLSTVSLRFENGNRISFSAPFLFANGQVLPNAPVLDFPLSETKLVRVLGCRVGEVKCDTDGTLELLFSNGDTLIVYANDPAYEAYTLSIGGKNYTV